MKNSENLKKYCKYLIDEYDKVKLSDEGSLLRDLNRFYDEGTIKDSIYKNTSVKIKIETLNFYKYKIESFALFQFKVLDLLSYEDFIK